MPQPPPNQVASGNFVQLDCIGSQARVVLQAGTNRKTFLIDDPGKIQITGKESTVIDLACGPQKLTPAVRVEFIPAVPAKPGIEGIVRKLDFGQ